MYITYLSSLNGQPSSTKPSQFDTMKDTYYYVIEEGSIGKSLCRSHSQVDNSSEYAGRI